MATTLPWGLLRMKDANDQAAAVILPMVIGVATATALLLLQRRRHASAAATTIVGPLPPSERGWIPYVGKALEFFPDVNAFMADRRRRHTRPSASAAGAGAVIGPFRVHLMGRWWTMVHELPDVKTVLNARDSELSFLDGFRDLMAGMLPKAFTFIPRHHFFLPLLREANLRSFVTVMVQEARPVLASSMMAARASSSMVDLFDACRRAVMRMNLRVLFGPQVFEAGRADAYYAAFEAVDPEKSLVDLLGSLLRPSQKERAWATIRGITAEMLAYYESREGADGGNGDEGVECALQLLVRQAGAAGAGPLDVDTVTNDLVAFVFASFTNTFAVLAWCIWELAGDKALQERFLAETRAVFTPEAHHNLDALLDGQLRVGKSVIEEVIRLRTPGLFFRKVVAPAGVTLSTGERVPCGDFIAFSARHLHTHPRLYPTNPTQFDLDRYLERDEQRAHAGALALQWGGGRHLCLGAKFAQWEMLVLVHELFTHWRVERVVEVDAHRSSTDARVGGEEEEPPPYWAQVGSPEVSKSQLGTVDKPTRPVYVRCSVAR